MSLAVGAKAPGQGVSIRTVHMDFLYGGAFRVGLPEAYERLILDCLLGDATLFTRADEVEEQWALVDAMVAPWKRDRPLPPTTQPGPGDPSPRTSSSTETVAPGGGIDRWHVTSARLERELAGFARGSAAGPALRRGCGRA